LAILAKECLSFQVFLLGLEAQAWCLAFD
jgi:hypothetical protein